MTQLSNSQIKLQERAKDLAQRIFLPRAAEVDQTEKYPWESIKALNDAGFMGMTIPKQYGGQGRDYYDTVLVIEEMARCCATMGRITVEANMGAIGAVMKYGSEKQKRLAADYVLSGDKPAICISEPKSGSAATQMTTTGVKHGNTYLLNGQKYWITGGGVSRFHLIFAKVMENGISLGIAGFIAIRDETAG